MLDRLPTSPTVLADQPSAQPGPLETSLVFGSRVSVLQTSLCAPPDQGAAHLMEPPCIRCELSSVPGLCLRFQGEAMDVR